MLRGGGRGRGEKVQRQIAKTPRSEKGKTSQAQGGGERRKSDTRIFGAVFQTTTLVANAIAITITIAIAIAHVIEIATAIAVATAHLTPPPPCPKPSPLSSLPQ